MKTLRILFYTLLLQGFLSVAWAAEDSQEGGEIPGCGEDAQCDTCIDNALRAAKKQVDKEGTSGKDGSSGTLSQ